MSANQNTTVAEVIRSATGTDPKEGVWVNGALEVAVRNAQPKNGRAPSKATAYDPHTGQEIKLASFGLNLASLIGRLIRIDGKGNKAKEFNGEIEVTVGKNGTIDDIGAADGRPAPAPRASNPAPRDDSRGGPPPDESRHSTPAEDPPPAEQRVDPVVYFHREMAKLGLGYLHALQYADDVQERYNFELTPEQAQACVSTIFISADKRGLFHKVPKLREIDDKGHPLRFIPPTAPTVDQAELDRQRKEAEEKAAREATEKARRQHEQEQRERQANLDEDVPF